MGSVYYYLPDEILDTEPPRTHIQQLWDIIDSLANRHVCTYCGAKNIPDRGFGKQACLGYFLKEVSRVKYFYREKTSKADMKKARRIADFRNKVAINRIDKKLRNKEVYIAEALPYTHPNRTENRQDGFFYVCGRCGRSNLN